MDGDQIPEDDQGQQDQSGSADSLINKAQSAQRNLKRARTVGSATRRGARVTGRVGRRVATRGTRVAARIGAQAARIAATLAAQAAAAAAQFAVATAPVWVPVAAIIAGVVLFIMILTAAFTFFFVGTPTTSGGEGTPIIACAGTCQTSACTAPNVEDTTATCDKSASGETQTCCLPPLELPANCAKYATDPLGGLKNIFNINATGGSTANYSKLFTYLCEAARAPNFTPLLIRGGGVLRVYLNDTRYTGICEGWSPFGSNAVYFGPWTCGASERNMKHFVLHEFGHVVFYRNDMLASRYTLGKFRITDSSCYDSAGYLITYSLSSSCSVSSDTERIRKESFAESIAEYIVPLSVSSGKCSRVISNFPTTCDNTYGWFKDNVFGGFTY